MDHIELFEKHCQLTKDQLMRDGEIHPIFWAYKGEPPEVLVLPLMMTGDTFEKQQDSKKKILEIFEFIFFCKEIEYYVVSMECWFLIRQEPVEEALKKIKGSLEHIEGRREAVMITLVSQDKVLTKVFEIIRSPGGIELKLYQESPGDMSGDFVNLLPPKDKKPTEKDKLMLEYMMKQIGREQNV